MTNGDPSARDELVTHDTVTWHRLGSLCAQCARGVPIVQTAFPIRTAPRLTDRFLVMGHAPLDRGEL